MSRRRDSSRTIARALIACAIVLPPATPLAQSTSFDGRWRVAMTCPPHAGADDDAKGYSREFPVAIENGNLRGTYGKEGEPGSMELQGPIAADGSATLRIHGVVNNPDYAIRHAQRGKPYTYRVRAQFEATSGTGQRLTGRACEFRFARDPKSP